MLRIVFFKTLVFLFFFSCSKNKEHLPYFNSPDFNPIFLKKESEIEKKITHKISNFNLTSDKKNIINTGFLKGKIHVANFMFTRCGGICPRITNNLKKLEKFKNNSNFLILSFSVTPWIDSIKQLKSYIENYDIKMKNWHFITGKRNVIYTLARQSYFAEEEIGFTKDSTEFLHTEHVLLVDQNLRIRGVYNGTLPLEINNLSKDIETLLN